MGRRARLECPSGRRNLSCHQNHEELWPSRYAVNGWRRRWRRRSAVLISMRRSIRRRGRCCARPCMTAWCCASATSTLRLDAFRDAMTIFGTPVVRMQLAQHPDCREVNIISSEDRDQLGDGKRLVNGAHWHTDDSFMREPCSLIMLYGVEVPSTGGRGWSADGVRSFAPTDGRRRIARSPRQTCAAARYRAFG